MVRKRRLTCCRNCSGGASQPTSSHGQTRRARSAQRVRPEPDGRSRRPMRCASPTRMRTCGRARAAAAAHCAAMVGFLDRGAEVFDYGNVAAGRGQARWLRAGVRLPGLRTGVHPAPVLRRAGPFRWVALWGDPADIAATDKAVLEEFPDDEGLARWIRHASERIAFQGLPARICWLGYGERAQLGLRFNAMVAQGNCERRSSSGAIIWTRDPSLRHTVRPRGWPMTRMRSPTGRC